MLSIVHGPITAPHSALSSVALRVDRITLAKRLWRGTAEDGAEFGFELDTPLKHGDVVHETSVARYVITQQEEPVIEIPLDMQPSAAAGIGWSRRETRAISASVPSEPQTRRPRS